MWRWIFFLSSRRYFTHEYNNMGTSGMRYPLPNTAIITILIIYALNKSINDLDADDRSTNIKTI